MKNIIKIAGTFSIVTALFLVGCSKTKQDYSKEYNELQTQIEQLLSEQKNDEAIEKAKESLEIAKDELKDNDKVLKSLNMLSGIYDLKSDFKNVNKYSYMCMENNDFTNTQENNLLYIGCMIFFMKSNEVFGDKEYQNGNWKQALDHFDKAQRGAYFLNHFYNQDILNLIYSQFNFNPYGVADKILAINKKYIHSLPKNKNYSSQKPVVLFILDGSGSMDDLDAQNGIKIDVAKNVIFTALNKLDESKTNSSLITFNKGCNDIDLLVAPNNSKKSNIVKKMDLIYPVGNTPLAKSIKEAGKILKDVNQYTRVVVVSDGDDTCDGDPCQAVKELKDEYGINVEVFTIGYGVDYSTKATLQCMAKNGGGKYFDVTNKTDFVSAFDNIIPTEERDSDWDGVLNRDDKCPNTPKGVNVDKYGCAEKYKFKVNFEFNSTTLTDDSINEIRNFSIFLKNNPAIKVDIEGHTDSIGSEVQNQILSQRRAEAVLEKLVEFGIRRDRLKAIGYGESMPIEIGNHSANRRVEASLKY